MSTTIRVSDGTKDRLAKLAKATGRPMTEVVEDAVEALERQTFFNEFNARYRELRSDPGEWAAIEAERALEEGAIRDASR